MSPRSLLNRVRLTWNAFKSDLFPFHLEYVTNTKILRDSHKDSATYLAHRVGTSVGAIEKNVSVP